MPPSMDARPVGADVSRAVSGRASMVTNPVDEADPTQWATEFLLRLAD